MRSRTTFLHTLIVLFGAAMNAAAQCTSYSCPPCVNNIPPMPGHGAAPDGSGRRVMNVFIDGTWGTPTNATIYNATNQAIGEWNAATDPSCGGGAGTQTGYYLYLNQGAGAGPADIIIQKDDFIASCGGNVRTFAHTTADIIKLRTKVGTLSQNDAAKAIKHELGHSLGLENCSGSCYGGGSIMCAVASLATCIATRSVILASDVAQSNRNLGSNRPTCAITAPAAAPLDADVCPDNNSCSGPDSNGNPVFNPDYCQYDYGCTSGFHLQQQQPGQNCCVADWSPILIDVSGDGFELTSAKQGVMFDLNDSGTKQKFSWTAPGVLNGWLVLDRNGNGQIDSGAEMFGNYTAQLPSPDPNGFHALAVYDRQDHGGNGNGEIDAGDDVFKSLMIWIDRNHNGISERNEMYPLKTFGIEAISVTYQLSKWTDQYGNAFRYRGRIRIASHPGDHWAYDVLLVKAH